MDTYARKLHGIVLLISFTQLQFFKQLYSVNICIVMYFKKLEMHLWFFLKNEYFRVESVNINGGDF